MSFNRPFGTKRDAGEEIGGNEDEKRKLKRWNSFMVDLEEECDESDEEPNANVEHMGDNKATTNVGGFQECEASNVPTNHWNGRGSIMNSIYMQELTGNNSMAPVNGSLGQQKPTAPLPLTLPLQEWIAHHKKNGSQTNLMYPGSYSRSIDKMYLEETALVAIFLAKKLLSTSSVALVIDNVVVSDTKSGAVEFVNLDTPSGDSPSTFIRRKAIYALGRIYYEMFTQGLSPPSSTEQESTSDVALNITTNEDDDGDTGDAGNWRKQPRRLSKESGHGHYTTLQLAGVPPSLCRLVAHMLENDNASGGLFCADESVASLSDVVNDLQQMVDNPISYLHDTLIMRLEPIIPENKLYGRIDELHQCLEIAETIPLCECTPERMELSQSIIMISGFSGCGKSFLVKEVGLRLEKKGWQCLQCKFDQEVRSQPLSTISLAFDNLVVNIVCNLDNVEQKEVSDRIHGLLEDDDVDALCHLIPTLRQLMTVENACHPEPKDEISFDVSDAASSKFRLHRLFGLLVKALSEPKRPLLICMDDLQWADRASYELINSLVEGIASDELVSTTVKHEGPCMLFVGCFRSNEVAGSGSLAACIQKLKDCKTTALEEIHLEGLSSDDVNTMISEALCYPRRLTRSLANLIHQKSTGNPLFVKEFLNSLATENLLKYSLSSHRWLWDEDVIEMKAVSNGVVDLLTIRLQRLSEGALSVLQVMSCLGHDVSLEILVHMGDVCGNSDVMASLDCATKELLIKKSDHRDQSIYSFVHDMVQNTVYQGIEEQHRLRMLKEIAETLIAKTSEGRKDAIIFIIVDLINRVSHRNTPSAVDRARYARFNLLAGEKSIQTPDFSSAFEFIEHGISFLDAGHWEKDYDLSLELFKNAAGIACSLGKSHLKTKYLNEVFHHAQCYEDKLDSMSVLIQSLTSDGMPQKALDNVFQVLSYLGEPLPTNLDKEAIYRELIATQECLQQISTSSWDTIPAMKDPLKIKAMHFLYHTFCPSYFQGSLFFVVSSCRMVRLTLSHGFSIYSPVAIAGMSSAYTAAVRDYTKGYKLGKLALRLGFNTSPKLLGEISLIVINVPFVFKEPIQALLPTILENYKMALKCGDITAACWNSVFYAIRAFLSGSPLTSLNKELSVFFRLMIRHNLVRHYLSLIPVYSAMANLSGEPQSSVMLNSLKGYEDNEKSLSEAFKKKDIGLCELIVGFQITQHFLFRRIDMAAKLLRQYQEFFDESVDSQVKFIFIYRTFFSGLVAFHCFRETQDQYWMDRGRNAIREMEIWMKECKWNFENKVLLLNAEYHFSIGDFDKATTQYHLSISSSHAHRFINEEAVANELAGYFQLKRGRKDLSIKLMKQARECYQTWGAVRKAETLQNND